MDRKHAKLSASSSGKWLVCTPSAQLEDEIPDEDSPFAAEGTLAHELFAQVMTDHVSGLSSPTVLASKEMAEHVQAAVNYAIALIGAAYDRCKDPVILIERRLDYSPWVPEGFGTGDLVIITDDLVEVADLKYGKGTFVSAQENSQMRLYGLGAYNELSMLYDIKRVRTHVLQPRMDNWGSEELTVEELLQWAEQVVVPKALIAWEGEGERVAGEHCGNYFCRARFTCPARNASAQELVTSSFALLPADELTPAQMSQVLLRADEVIKWLNDSKAWAFKRMTTGGSLPGWKLVEGRSNRKYTDEGEVAKAIIASGVEEVLIYERSLLGITAMEKLVGKKKFAEVLGKLIEKPQGKPTLAPESDKRPAIDSLGYFTDESQED